jgi:hypothetical protein
MKKMCLMVPLLALCGCSMFSGKPYPLVETEPATVKDCRAVGEFPGPIGYRVWGPPALLSDFKFQTAEKAKLMGATHIYWRENQGPEGFEGRIVGYAFDCTGVHLPDEDEDEY